jgi:preprotein translocase subunit SecD
VIAERLGPQNASVSTRGDDLLVDLAPLEPEQLRAAKMIVSDSGRLEFKMLDDPGTQEVFGSLAPDAYPGEEGIERYQEDAPDGQDASGRKRSTRSYCVRVSCQPSKYASESLSECQGRLKRWAAALKVSKDHQVGFEAVTEAVPNVEPTQFKQVGWRTVYMFARAELTQTSITDVNVGRDAQNFGQYYVLLSFSPGGAARFEEVTGANVNRRFAIVRDDVVVSAPVIKQRIGGGKATITMGAGDPEKQLHDAKHLALVTKSGALPAPLSLVSEEPLRPGRR